MPSRPSKRAGKRVATRNRRCCFQEGSRRCPAVGTGNPPLCDPHRISVMDTLTSRPQGVTRLFDMLGDFLAGKRINGRDAIGVAREIYEDWQSSMGGGYRPPINEQDRTDHRQRDGQSAPNWPPGGQPGDGAGARRRWRPPDPDAVRAAAYARARKVMGFAPDDVLTVEEVNARRKRLARKHHPDLGGSTERMARINEAADLLLESLNE